MKTRVLPVVIGAAFAAAAGAASAQTLDTVTQRGALSCGVNTGLAGFSNANDAGEWTGLDVDLCRAIAAAIFDDPDAVQFVPTSAQARFEALRSGEIDVLVRNTTWTMSRDTELGFNFAGVNYYDGQGFMIREDLGVTSALELDGASVCVQTGTTTELNLTDFFRVNGISYDPVVFQGLDESVAAYEAGRCEVYTTDASGLYSLRLTLANPEEHMVLPEIISKEPLGPAVRHGDDQWFDIVKWVHNAMLNAEELGVTQENVDEMLESDNVEIQRLLGREGTFGTMIGLENDWAYKVIKHVGNYGESFDRNVGEGSPLAIARGLNALWTEGGIQYAPPVR